ncbi:four-helix bundle copper-binding protein [Phytoactinopolyspora halotolerans]|uniref:Four-helix bundle copper-binding protein n=1 Tax=Phytoactinopolyspora halotolerans TaxID=1981512 RepID=A0A6L9SBD6_9ACTN|nr:four-helix bundle copper-binding protein [Phytoactinopolyspora halotolerans]NEE02373.1 four-helix bundle copper-binding protein [Phytoactinopolyspora halotolerans]
MTYTRQLIDTYPAEINLDRAQLAEVIDALSACAQACSACADACLSESADALPRLARCIRDNLDCADICAATAAVLTRQTGYDARVTHAQVQAAAQATRTCGDSCAEHGETHAHCRVCEQACRETEQLLKDLLPQVEPSGQGPSRPSQAAPQT